jgi:ABC-type transporter Mla subunit MlaD
MSQVRNKRQNNVRAGVFVTISLILGLVVFSILTNAWERMMRSTSSYSVTFPIQEGIGMLSTGSQVRLGGVLIGEVTSVVPRVELDAPTSLIDVQFEIDSQYALYDDAAIHAREGLLGSTGWLSITNVGSGTIASMETGLVGTTETMLAQMLGNEAELNIAKSLDALRKISEALSVEGGALSMLIGVEEAKSITEAINSAKEGLVAIDSIVNSAETVWPKWKDSITSLLEDSGDLPTQLSDTLREVKSAVHDVRTNVLPDVERSMNSLQRVMASLESISDTYKESAPKWAAQISGIVRNVDHMTYRAKSAIDDISSSPWRLLYRPTDREIAYEQLNAASWQLLSALSDLRQSANALKAASLSSDAPKEAAALAESLAESEASFKQARDAILERMKLEFPNR